MEEFVLKDGVYILLGLFIIFWFFLSLIWPFAINPIKNMKNNDYKKGFFGKKYYKSDIEKIMEWRKIWTFVWIFILIVFFSQIF